MSVKSDNPSRPGGCSCRKMTSCSAPLSARQLRMRRSRVRRTAPDLVENGHWPQARRALQQRHHLAVPNRSERIRPSADARRFLLRGKPWILFDAIAGGSTEPGLGRGNRRRLGLAKTHVQPHLAISDVAAGQVAVLIGMKDPLPIRPAVTARKHGPSGVVPVARFATAVGLRPPSFTHPVTLSYPD